MADGSQQRVTYPFRFGGGPDRVHLFGKARAFERGTRLVAGATRDRGGEYSDGEQHEQRQELVQLGDYEGVQRFNEEEVVGEKRKS